jgi:hypothetical protein
MMMIRSHEKYMSNNAKNSIKNLMVRTITQKTKGKAKERPKDMQPAGIKEGRELILW